MDNSTKYLRSKNLVATDETRKKAVLFDYQYRSLRCRNNRYTMSPLYMVWYLKETQQKIQATRCGEDIFEGIKRHLTKRCRQFWVCKMFTQCCCWLVPTSFLLCQRGAFQSIRNFFPHPQHATTPFTRLAFLFSSITIPLHDKQDISS